MTRHEAMTMIAEALNEDPRELSEGTELESLATWDSVGQVSVMAVVDATLSRPLLPEEMRACASVGDLIDLLGEQVR